MHKERIIVHTYPAYFLLEDLYQNSNFVREYLVNACKKYYQEHFKI